MLKNLFKSNKCYNQAFKIIILIIFILKTIRLFKILASKIFGANNNKVARVNNNLIN